MDTGYVNYMRRQPLIKNNNYHFLKGTRNASNVSQFLQIHYYMTYTRNNIIYRIKYHPSETTVLGNII